MFDYIITEYSCRLISKIFNNKSEIGDTIFLCKKDGLIIEKVALFVVVVKESELLTLRKRYRPAQSEKVFYFYRVSGLQ